MIYPLTDYPIFDTNTHIDTLGYEAGLKKDESGKDIYLLPLRFGRLFNIVCDMINQKIFIEGNLERINYFQGRDGKSLEIFNLQKPDQSTTLDCHSFTVRWSVFYKYYLYQRAWNQLCNVVSRIIKNYRTEYIGDQTPFVTPQDHRLSDWVLLWNIHIVLCLEMQYSIPSLLWNKDFPDKNFSEILLFNFAKDDKSSDNTKYHNHINALKKQIAFGLFNLYRRTLKAGMNRPYLEREIARKEWIEYAIPLLSTDVYCSKELGKWIRETWFWVLTTGDDKLCEDKEKDNKCKLSEKFKCSHLFSKSKNLNRCIACPIRIFHRIYNRLLGNQDDAISSLYVGSEYKNYVRIHYSEQNKIEKLKYEIVQIRVSINRYNRRYLPGLRVVTTRLVELKRRLKEKKDELKKRMKSLDNFKDDASDLYNFICSVVKSFEITDESANKLASIKPLFDSKTDFTNKKNIFWKDPIKIQFDYKSSQETPSKEQETKQEPASLLMSETPVVSEIPVTPVEFSNIEETPKPPRKKTVRKKSSSRQNTEK